LSTFSTITTLSDICNYVTRIIQIGDLKELLNDVDIGFPYTFTLQSESAEISKN